MVGGRGTLVRMGLLALMWGSSFLWIKLALAAFTPVQITVARCVLGAVVVVAICYSAGHRLPRTPKVWGHLAIAAFFGNALPFALFGIGEQTVDSGVAGVLNATTPLWALLLGVLLGTDRALRPVRLGGLLLGFGGTLLIFAPWERAGLAGWGSLAILAAAASYAVSYVHIGRNLTGRGVPPQALSAAQLLSAVWLSSLALPLDGQAPGGMSAMALISVGVLGVFGTGFAFALNYRLIADEGPTNATVVGYLLPVVSVLLGAAFLGEALNPRVVLGMVVVLVGVAMTRVGPTAVKSGGTTGRVRADSAR